MDRSGYAVDKASIKRDWPIHVIIAADVLFGAGVYSRLPARVPIHWGPSGPNDWAPGWFAAGFIPLLLVVLYVYHLYAPFFSQKAERYARDPRYYRLYRGALSLLLALIHVAVMVVTLVFYA